MFSYVSTAAVLVFVLFVELNNEQRIRFGEGLALETPLFIPLISFLLIFFNGGQFTLSTQ